MIEPSENIELAKHLQTSTTKVADDPLRKLCTTISNFPSHGSAEPILRFVVTTNSIEIKLSNNEPVTALRFELEFAKGFKYKIPELSARIQTLSTNINFQDNILTFVLLDISGTGIAPGSGTIVSIPFEDGKNFRVTAAYAATRTSGLKEMEYTISDYESSNDLIVLEQNDPNPFSVSTRIEFQIPERERVKVIIYDVDGALIRTLADSTMDGGTHTVEWNGTDDGGNEVEPGVYFYKLYAGVYSLTKKMVFAK
jgi:hypothetical protein